VASGNDQINHAVQLTQYIFHHGFHGQNWADIQLLFLGISIKLHRIILARSPFLCDLMMNVGPGQTIQLPLSDENITSESVLVALQHLYTPAQLLVNPDNARAVLATAVLLHCMPELEYHAYEVCRHSITDANVVEYVAWLGQGPSQMNESPVMSTVFGSVTMDNSPLSIPSVRLSEIWVEDGAYVRYGQWSRRLKQDVLDYLLEGLPQSVGTPLSASDARLLTVYSRLPFDLFKLCTESPQLEFEKIKDRFAFAKTAIAHRKKLGTTDGMEEAVVLAMKGGDGMEIHVTRKPRKSRPALWKVEA